MFPLKFVCVFACVCMWYGAMCVYVMWRVCVLHERAHKDEKRVFSPLNLELPLVVSCPEGAEN